MKNWFAASALTICHENAGPHKPAACHAWADHANLPCARRESARYNALYLSIISRTDASTIDESRRTVHLLNQAQPLTFVDPQQTTDVWYRKQPNPLLFAGIGAGILILIIVVTSVAIGGSGQNQEDGTQQQAVVHDKDLRSSMDGMNPATAWKHLQQFPGAHDSTVQWAADRLIREKISDLLASKKLLPDATSAEKRATQLVLPDHQLFRAVKRREADLLNIIEASKQQVVVPEPRSNHSQQHHAKQSTTNQHQAFVRMTQTRHYRPCRRSDGVHTQAHENSTEAIENSQTKNGTA